MNLTFVRSTPSVAFSMSIAGVNSTGSVVEVVDVVLVVAVVEVVDVVLVVEVVLRSPGSSTILAQQTRPEVCTIPHVRVPNLLLSLPAYSRKLRSQNNLR